MITNVKIIASVKIVASATIGKRHFFEVHYLLDDMRAIKIISADTLKQDGKIARINSVKKAEEWLGTDEGNKYLESCVDYNLGLVINGLQ